MNRIYFIIIVFLSSLLHSQAQEQFDKDTYYAFKTSTWKGDAAPDLFEIKIDNSPLVQSYVYTDLLGNSLSGNYQIIIHPKKYVVVQLSNGVVDGTFTLYSWNQEVSKYRMKKGIYDGEQSVFNGSEIYLYKDGEIAGYTEYHSNKQLKCNIKYKDGKREGLYTEYNPSGKIVVSKNYLNGKVEGEVREEEFKDCLRISNYTNDVLNGRYSETYNDGTLRIEGYYAMGKKDKTWKSFDKKGHLEFQEEYNNGVLNGQKKRFRDGILIYSEEYKDGLRNGLSVDYVDNGGKNQLEKEVNFLQGKRNGITKRYNNGILTKEALYKDDKLITDKSYDYSSGIIKSEGLYKNENLIGEKKYENGKLKYLLLEDENGSLQIVREYTTTGQSVKKNNNYKKGDNVKLVEDEWGIIDI